MEQSILIFKVVAFLLWVNLLPPLARLILEDRFNQPLDWGTAWLDGRCVLGPHKTWRGIVFGLLGSLIFVPILRVGWWPVLIGAALSLCGDLITSFIKRRLNQPSGEVAPVLDQFLEGLLPALFLGRCMPWGVAGPHYLNWPQIFIVLPLFIAIGYLSSRVWKWLVYHPLPENSLRIIRTTTRPREWRAFHQPLSRYRTLFNFEHFILYRMIIAWTFKGIGLYKLGVHNALAVATQEHDFFFADLPKEFEGFRIMLLTDLHLDGIAELPDRIIDIIKYLDVDLCLIGGDIRMEAYGSAGPSLRRLRRVLKNINSRHGIYGVLGNHDCIEMVPDLEEAGIVMLINNSCCIEKQGSRIWIVGIDDPHFYKVQNFPAAFRAVPAAEFCILLSHSPEAYQRAADFKPALYLCGHTHGGQIRLPWGGPIFTNSRAPKFTAEGVWHYKGMAGFTSRGAGASGVPLRFNCPGEINLITLKSREKFL